MGFFPSEVIEACPVLPRAALIGNVETSLLVAAYLGQPLILRAHHRDVMHGVEIFDEVAGFINGLGSVVWSNLTGLSRLNYLWRMEAATCCVKPLGRKIVFQVPSAANEVFIEGCDAMDGGLWETSASDGTVRRIVPGEKFSVSGGDEIMLERVASQEVERARVKPKGTNAGLILRRLLTEARDRLCIS